MDRVVEIRDCFSSVIEDFSHLQSLRKIHFSQTPRAFDIPEHLKLKRLTVRCREKDRDPFTLFPADCAEQLVFIFQQQSAYVEAKARQLPPNVRVLCSELGAGVALEDFVCWEHNTATISLSETFGVDELRKCNDTSLFSFDRADLIFSGQRSNDDLSFLSFLTYLNVLSVSGHTLTLPTSVANLNFEKGSKDAVVSGTEGLTRLRAKNGSFSFTPCPNLQELEWRCSRLSGSVPFPWAGLTALSALTVRADGVDPDFQFPPSLVRMDLKVGDGPSFDGATLAPLTRLQHLEISVRNNPLDLSGLVSLTSLISTHKVSGLPTSIVECDIRVRSGGDLSAQTNLTRLIIRPQEPASMKFPLQLKRLTVYTDDAGLWSSNLDALHLESFVETTFYDNDPVDNFDFFF